MSHVMRKIVFLLHFAVLNFATLRKVRILPHFSSQIAVFSKTTLKKMYVFDT